MMDDVPLHNSIRTREPKAWDNIINIQTKQKYSYELNYTSFIILVSIVESSRYPLTY